MDNGGGRSADRHRHSSGGGRSWRDWYVLGVVIGAAAFCLGPSLVGARTLISVNSLTNWFPWRARGDDAVGHELCQSDTIDYFMPGVRYLRTQLLAGHLASWQNISAGGGEFSAVPNLGLLDPLSLPYWILPLWLAPVFVVLMCWVAAIGGTYLFLRRLSVGRPAATLAGFVFATSGFMVMWSNWPQARVAALIPALFWTADRIATRRRPIDVVLLAVIVASMIFGGFPAVTGWGIYMAGGYFVVRVYFLYRGSWRSMLTTGALAAGGIVLGGVITAVQTLPFVHWYSVVGKVDKFPASKVGLPVSGLLTLFDPNSDGLCVVGKTNHGSVNPVELVAYVGAGALMLALFGAAFAVRRRRTIGPEILGYFVAVMAAIILVCWLSPTARGVVAHLPVFSGSFIGRIRSLAGFGLAVLAGFGFDWLTGESRDRAGLAELRRPWTRTRSRAAVWVAVVWGAAAVVGLMAARAAHRAAFEGHYVSFVEKAVWIPTVLLVVSFVIILVGAAARGRAEELAFIVLPILVVAQGVQFFHTVMPGDSRASFYPNTGDHQFLEAHLGDDRLASAGLSLYPATALYYGLRTATAHEFTDPRWVDLLTAIDPTVMMSPTNSDFAGALNQANIADQPILDQMGVKYFVLPPTDLVGASTPMPTGLGSVSSASGPLTCTLPPGGLRGVTVKLAHPVIAENSAKGATVSVVVHSGAIRVSSGLFVGPDQAAGPMSIGVAGEGLGSDAPSEVTFSVQGAKGPLILTSSGGGAACAAVRPDDDGLKLVYADSGAIIYERLDALPRIRWASQSTVVTDPAAEVSDMAHGGLAPAEVMLGEAGPPASGRPATVRVEVDSGDEISAAVDAQGQGYLVVADSMQQPGWRVTVDGKAAPLLPADHAMVAVPVPAGTHRITFRYTAPGERSGAALTLVAVVVSMALIWYDVRQTRLRRPAARRQRGQVSQRRLARERVFRRRSRRNRNDPP